MFRLLYLTAIIAMHIGVNATNYYIDSNNGDDKNSGLSPEQAWASLTKVNNTSFHAGDSILFKSGSVWKGQLLIDDKGCKS